MKKSPFYIPPGYVATRMDLVVMVFYCLLMFGLGLMMWEARVEVPPVPKEVVLRSAYVTQPLSRSKSSVYLYFNVERGEGDYKYSIEFPSYESNSLNVRKHGKLWVAVDANSDNEFVWAVYDDEFRLMMSRQQIAQWAKDNNFRSYLMIACFYLAVGYFVFYIIRYGVFNRYCQRKVFSEDRES
ncbi:hypothetical protein TU86_06805 [Pseudomonas weihenstephanensis]|uniref:Uncharacterized protein n=1 Tax=Pseudomonas weihenstephanensis TaxID=1608994 RepID=A0A0J6IK88_9PSED|nr:hypothetical protein [Pseudomonas weihenstephanensis]KMN14995.1 hypothetical protein TU86_06805 [Pseudomonas weihenstephanensis]